MPLFEYACKSCNHQFEYLVQVGEGDPEKCPNCGAIDPARKPSSFAVSVSSGNASETCGSGRPPECASGACPYA